MTGHKRWFRPVDAQTIWIVVLVIGLGGIICWGYLAWREARLYQRQVDLKYREWQSLTRSVSAPAERPVTTIAAEIVRAEQMRQALQEELQGNVAGARRMLENPVPSNGTEFYFDLAAFMERTRERAHLRGVILKQDERFGFTQYAHGGPVEELVPRLFRQRLIIEQLLGALLEAQPRKLLLVQREAVVPPMMTGGASDDVMIMPPKRSLRMDGLVTAIGFRLGFTGYTSTLRAFFNELESLELPVFVRMVEAEPDLTESELKKGTPEPLVVRARSKFTVTLEYLELAPPIPPST